MRQIAGVQFFLVYEGKLLLILRDDKPDIRDDPVNGIYFPNTWALPGGGVEEGEDFFKAAVRELFEELRIRIQLQILGVSPKGNCYLFSEIEEEVVGQIVLGEGQRCEFFEPNKLSSLKLGGALKIYLEKYPGAIRDMILTGKPAKGHQLGLAIWNGHL